VLLLAVVLWAVYSWSIGAYAVLHDVTITRHQEEKGTSLILASRVTDNQ